MRKRFLAFNAFDGDFLIFFLNQVNASEGSRIVEGGASVEGTFLIFSR
jgi:hypothetical protein